MPRAGSAGSRSTNPEPPPPDTKWLLSAPGYRIGVHAVDGVIVEPLDYHAGYLVLERKDLTLLLKALKPE